MTRAFQQPGKTTHVHSRSRICRPSLQWSRLPALRALRSAEPSASYKLPVSRAGFTHPHEVAVGRGPVSSKSRMASGLTGAHPKRSSLPLPVSMHGACAVQEKCGARRAEPEATARWRLGPGSLVLLLNVCLLHRADPLQLPAFPGQSEAPSYHPFQGGHVDEDLCIKMSLSK